MTAIKVMYYAALKHLIRDDHFVAISKVSITQHHSFAHPTLLDMSEERDAVELYLSASASLQFIKRRCRSSFTHRPTIGGGGIGKYIETTNKGI